MHVLFQLTVCICMIILAAGSVSYVHDNPSFGGGFLLFVIWGIYGKLIVSTNALNFDKLKQTSSNHETGASNERISHLEKRLGDIQDIVITIDEKLSRSEKQSGAKIEEGEKV